MAVVSKINGYSIAVDLSDNKAVCNTSGGTAAKTATCPNLLTLSAGAVVHVYCSARNTSGGKLTLNVNSLGAKDVYVGGEVTSDTNRIYWDEGAVIPFVYDGTNWLVASQPACWYGTCETAKSTSEKASAIGGAVICKGTHVTVLMSNENTSTLARLNVSSTYGADILSHGVAPTTANGYGWSAGDAVTFAFDGKAWHLVDKSA